MAPSAKPQLQLTRRRAELSKDKPEHWTQSMCPAGHIETSVQRAVNGLTVLDVVTLHCKHIDYVQETYR